MTDNKATTIEQLIAAAKQAGQVAFSRSFFAPVHFWKMDMTDQAMAEERNRELKEAATIGDADHAFKIVREGNVDVLRDAVLNLSFLHEGYVRDWDRWNKEKAELEGTIDDLRGDLRRAESLIDDYRSEIATLESRIDNLLS